AALSAGITEEDGRAVVLKNVVWIRPVLLQKKPVQVHIRLHPEENGEIEYTIYNRDETSYETEVLHSQGSVRFALSGSLPVMDISALRAKCSQDALLPSQCYEIYSGMGIRYGPGHRGVEMLYTGTDQALAKLSLPSCIANTEERYVLHPSLTDSALQGVIGLLSGIHDYEPSLPFALQELE
ncbi:polyketide synthase dehydratase domain-containing protein, partial [Paenibacillus forsythiae]